MNIHLGAGNNIKNGWVNCDCRPLPGIDKVFDVEVVPWPFSDGVASKIITHEMLEHLSWRNQAKVFKEIMRVLKKGGQIEIQVPDIGMMCANYVNNEICDCVPHKEPPEGFKSDPNCRECKGKGIVNPMRWLQALCGAQKHPWDVHRTMFTREYLDQLLQSAGLTVVRYDKHPYKLKVLAEK